MSLRINTNITAYNAHRLLYNNEQNLSQSLARLSSGLRINNASDDAAGLAISEKMRSQINGLNQAQNNAQDAINLLQTAEGGMSETTSILQRMRQLAVQAANDTLTASDRSNISDELVALSSEIDRIASSTQFNTTVLLNGGNIALSTGMTFQVGANASQTLVIGIDTVNTAALAVAWSNLTVTSASFASATINAVDNALASVSTFRSHVGARVNRLQHTVANLAVQSQNMSSSESQIRDLDIASETTNLSKQQILTQSSQAMLAQANQEPQSVLALLR